MLQLPYSININCHHLPAECAVFAVSSCTGWSKFFTFSGFFHAADYCCGEIWMLKLTKLVVLHISSQSLPFLGGFLLAHRVRSHTGRIPPRQWHGGKLIWFLQCFRLSSDIFCGLCSFSNCSVILGMSWAWCDRSRGVTRLEPRCQIPTRNNIHLWVDCVLLVKCCGRGAAKVYL